MSSVRPKASSSYILQKMLPGITLRLHAHECACLQEKATCCGNAARPQEAPATLELHMPGSRLGAVFVTCLRLRLIQSRHQSFHSTLLRQQARCVNKARLQGREQLPGYR